MKISTNQKGFSAVEVVIVVAIIAIVGLVGYNVYNKQQANKGSDNFTSQTASNGSTNSETSDVATAPEIKSAKDLDTAASTLDSVNVSATSDEKQLDQDVSAF